MSAVTLREMSERDGPRYAALLRASPDTGAVRFSPEYVHDPVQVIRALRPDTVGVVAETGDGDIVGAALISFGACEVEGAPRPYALLNALAVHPAFRGRGVASQLTRWRLERAKERTGSDGAVLAMIQTGNAGSFANARKWATQIFGRIVTTAHPMRSRPPRTGRYEIREATEADWRRVADGVARFESGSNLRVRETAETLRAWTAAAPFGARFRHQLIAIDTRGHAVAGAAVAVQAELMRLRVEQVPPAIRLANLALRVIPPDRIARQLVVYRLWFEEGAEAGARAAWEHARWAYRERANTILTWFDARGRVAGVLPVRPWTPKTTATLAVRSSVRLDETRPLVPIV